MSQDEVWEWAIKMSKKYGVTPIRVIGMLDTYSFDGYKKGMNRVEEKIKNETECEKTKINKMSETRGIFDRKE